MSKPLMVFEDIQTTPKRRLFSLFGIEWFATPYAWLSVPGFLGAGILLALIGADSLGLTQKLTMGIGYGVILYSANIIHSLGHIFSGKLIAAPMDANLVTATRHINLYYGVQSGFSTWTHIARSLGGPGFNLLAGFISLAIWKASGGFWLSAFANLNVILGLGALMPFPSVDGWVIWGEILKLFQRRESGA